MHIEVKGLDKDSIMPLHQITLVTIKDDGVQDSYTYYVYLFGNLDMEIEIDEEEYKRLKKLLLKTKRLPQKTIDDPLDGIEIE